MWNIALTIVAGVNAWIANETIASNNPYGYKCPIVQASVSFAGNSNSVNHGASYMGIGANVDSSNSNSSGNNLYIQRDSNNLPEGIYCAGKAARRTCVPILCENLR